MDGNVGMHTYDRRTLSLCSRPMMGVLLLVCASGCGSPHGCVKVSGTVTLNGENPPGPGVVTFTVVEPAAGFPNRPTMAKFDTDGVYQATTYEAGDGLLPGSYRVSIECYETPPNMDGIPVESYIPNKYISPQTSGFELTVEPDSTPITFDIALAD